MYRKNSFPFNFSPHQRCFATKVYGCQSFHANNIDGDKGEGKAILDLKLHASSYYYYYYYYYYYL